jgi:hypothetical protein
MFLCFSSFIHAKDGVTIINANNGYKGTSVSSIGTAGSSFYAQSFVATVDTITRFGVFITELQSEGEVILAIAADNGSGAPNVNAPLYSGKLKNPSTTGAWFYEEGIKVPLVVGQKYWVLIDGYNNVGATGRSSIGLSANYTNTGEGMIYTNSDGSGTWNSISTMPIAVYIEDGSSVINENNGYNGNSIASIGAKGSNFYAQSFVASVTEIRKFGVFITEIESEGEVILAIAADNGFGSPNVNTPLYSGVLKNPSTVGAWFYEEGIKVPVTAGQKYWVLIDGYENASATGRSKIGSSDNYTSTRDEMLYSNTGGGSWSSVSQRMAIYVEGVIVIFKPTFAVSDTNGVPIAGATIALNGYGEKTTNASGIAVFDSVYETPTPGIPYKISANGYYTTSSSLIVRADTVMKIEMVPNTVGVHEISAVKRINIYPNPAKDIVNIISSEEIRKMEIITMQGTVVKTVIGEGKNEQINTSDIFDGNYLLIIRTETLNYIK